VIFRFRPYYNNVCFLCEIILFPLSLSQDYQLYVAGEYVPPARSAAAAKKHAELYDNDDEESFDEESEADEEDESAEDEEEEEGSEEDEEDESEEVVQSAAKTPVGARQKRSDKQSPFPVATTKRSFPSAASSRKRAKRG
jgi:hypothetical protein